MANTRKKQTRKSSKANPAAAQKQDTERRSVPPALEFLRAAVGPVFILAGFGMMPTYFWWGVILVYVGLVLSLLEVIWEPWLFKKSEGVQVSGVAAIFACACIFTIRVVLVPAPLEVSATSTIPTYGPGSTINGIDWQPQYSDLDLHIKNPTSTDYDSFDAELSTDLVIANLRQLHGVNECKVEGVHAHMDSPYSQRMEGGAPTGPATNSGYLVVPLDKNGNPLLPLSGGADWSYRIVCGKIPSNSESDFWGVLEVVNTPTQSMSNGTPLFGPPKAASWVTIKARFQTSGQKRAAEIAKCRIGISCETGKQN